MAFDLAVHPVGSLYVHVPFCVRKCLYCAFYSQPATAPLLNQYCTALITELELVAHDLRPATIYFGGGTPSLLGLAHWEKLAHALARLNLTSAVTEWTVECNPATVSAQKARLLKYIGVSRISLGVQSLEDELLARLGRVHTRQQVFKAFDTLRNAGFDNINIDLMFAIPGQTMRMWRQTLDEVIAMKPEHLSCYEITYEEDTPLFELLGADKSEAHEELACGMYEELVDRVTCAGFWQYEVSNFARHNPVEHAQAQPIESIPAFASRHNINYWRGGQFYGLGPSAASYVRGVHAKNYADVKTYCAMLEKGLRPIESQEQLSPLARAGEVAGFGLRMVSGWPFEEFKRVTGYDLLSVWRTEIDQLIERGWATVTSTGLRLTPQGLRFADAVAELFLR